jgi:hypothetical protein
MISREGAGSLSGDKQEPEKGTPARRLFQPGAITHLFRAVKNAITRNCPPAPEVRRKRREETGRAFRMTARKLLQRVTRIPAEAYASATAYLADTLDWLNQWQNYDDHSSEEATRAANDDLYPHP